MEEEYRKNFSKPMDKKNLSNDVDPLCLYVTNIPIYLTKEEFTSLMCRRSRNVLNVNFNIKVSQRSEYTYAFVKFGSYDDAFNAMSEFNENPPYFFQIAFARKKNPDKEDRNMKYPSRGRGTRIDLDGCISISQKLKVTAADGSGRRVTVSSPTKKSLGETTETINHSAVSPRQGDILLGPNPFYYCFHCKKEGRFACNNCKKPYCSKNCLVEDWNNHKNICNEIKNAGENLLKLYAKQTEAHDSSYQSESSSSELEKSQHKECYDVQKLLVSPNQVEKVLVVNIISPSKFWVQLKMFSDDFVKMEKELSLLQKNSSLLSVSCVENLNCCTVFNNKMYRAKVLKVKSPNEVLVSLFDYGKTVIVPKNSIFQLPKEFRMLPTQAICCKLIDETKEKDIDWNEEDSLSFQLHTSNKIYKAHILKYFNDVAEVSLINEDGITLFSILAEEKTTLPCVSNEPAVSLSDGIPPSVWSKMKPGAKMLLVPVPYISFENCVWCYLSADGGEDLSEILNIESLLQNYSGKDITMCAEEGDFAAGFSIEFKQFYRCMILKRKLNGFCVRYIDFGNEEEVTQLCSLSEELLGKFSFTVKCDKPDSLSIADFHKALNEKPIEVTVVNVSKHVAELSFTIQKQYTVLCHPCYPCFFESEEVIDEPKFPPGVNSFNETPQCKISPKPVEREISQPSLGKEVNIIKSKNLELNHLYNVKISFLRTVSNVYVQLKEDENKINKLCTDLSSYCNSNSTRHLPNVGETVCCKFSEDGHWYRGEVMEKVQNAYRVFFIDYGNEDLVSSHDIRLLPDRFKSSKFAIGVCLSGIRNEDLSKSLITKLLNENWDMKIIALKNIYEVVMYQKDCTLSSMVQKKVDNEAIKTCPKVSKDFSRKDNNNAIKSSPKQFPCNTDNGAVKSSPTVSTDYSEPFPGKEKIIQEVMLPHISSLKRQQLNDGTNKVKIICANDAGVLYCQLESDNDRILNMFKLLQNLSSQGELPRSLTVGNVIAAQSSDSCYYRASVLSASKEKVKVSFFDYGNDEIVVYDCIKILPEELLKMPIFGIPINIANPNAITGSDVFLEAISVEKIKVSENNVNVVHVIFENGNSNIVESAKNVSAIEEPSRKFTFDLCRSVAFNSGEQNILIYSVDEDGFVFCAPYNNENVIANIEYSDKLTEHCAQHGITFDSCEPEIGEMVFAQFPEDKKWYRAAVIDKSHPMYDVNFVDFGNTERLDISLLRKMEEQFMELEVQAHMCCLTGFTVKAGVDEQKVYKEVKNFTVFVHPEPLKAVVEVNDGEITANIPKITSWLVERQLVVPTN